MARHSTAWHSAVWQVPPGPSGAAQPTASCLWAKDLAQSRQDQLQPEECSQQAEISLRVTDITWRAREAEAGELSSAGAEKDSWERNRASFPIQLFHASAPPLLLPEWVGNSHGETWQQVPRLVLENGLLSSPGTNEAVQEHAELVEIRRMSRAPCTACSKASRAVKIKNLGRYRSSRKTREDSSLLQALWLAVA